MWTNTIPREVENMDMKRFSLWTREFLGIATAVKKVDGNNITAELVEKIRSITVKRIDQYLLSTVLENQYNHERDSDDDFSELITFRVSHLYIVWKDGYIEKSDKYLVSRATSSLALAYQDEPSTRTGPIASHFINRDDMSHIVLLIESGVCSDFNGEVGNINNIVITIYKPPKNFGLRPVARDIVAIFEKSGLRGLENYRENVWNLSKQSVEIET